MEYRYKTRGVCSSEILLELDGDVVKSAKFTGGCNGNLKGICSLIAGMKVDDVIARCKGIRCGFKPTSCPDQLANALMQAKEQQKKMRACPIGTGGKGAAGCSPFSRGN